MKTEETSPNTADIHTDEIVVLAHLAHGTPIDPQTYRRVRERAERITERLRQQFGEREIAVDLGRQVRDEQ